MSNNESNPDTNTAPDEEHGPPSGQWSAFDTAYDKRLPEIQAVREDDLIPINLDVRDAVATVLGVLPKINSLKSHFSELPRLDQAQLESLEEYAQAAAEAVARYEQATAPPEDIFALNDAAMKARETIRLDAVALSHRGLLDPAQVAAFKGLVGYKNVAFELLRWSNLMHQSWPKIQGKTALTPAEINEAKLLAERLLRAAGLKEQMPAAVAEVARIRQQAVTLLVSAYDQARRAIGFLRWDERDAEVIAPSLYGGRVRRSDKVAPAAAATTTTPAVTLLAHAPTATPAAPAVTVPVGFPEGPFIGA